MKLDIDIPGLPSGSTSSPLHVGPRTVHPDEPSPEHYVSCEREEILQIIMAEAPSPHSTGPRDSGLACPVFDPPMLIISSCAWKPSNEHDGSVGNVDLMEFEVYDWPTQDLGNTFLDGNSDSPEDTDIEDDTNTREPSTSQLAFVNAIGVLTHTQKLQIPHTVRKSFQWKLVISVNASRSVLRPTE